MCTTIKQFSELKAGDIILDESEEMPLTIHVMSDPKGDHESMFVHAHFIGADYKPDVQYTWYCDPDSPHVTLDHDAARKAASDA